MPTVLDGKYVELWNVPSWRRKLGIGESFPTVFERIETIVSGGISSISSASERLAAFATLEEAGYVVQTSTAPPTFAGRQIRGVPNRINVTFGTGIPGDTIIQTPQDIHVGATPSFRTIKPTALDREFVTYVNGVGELASTTVTADELTTLATAVGLTGVLQGNGPGNPITAALGTPGYLPRWSATDPYLTLTSSIQDDLTNVRIAAHGIPDLDITYDLGTSLLRWRKLWVQDIDASGSVTIGAFTPGSVIFAGAGGLLSQDNANFFWDDATNRLALGHSAPAYPLDVAGVIGLSGNHIVDTTSSAGTMRIGGTNLARYVELRATSSAATVRGFASTANELRLGGGANDHMVITAAGEVVIGGLVATTSHVNVISTNTAITAFAGMRNDYTDTPSGSGGSARHGLLNSVTLAGTNSAGSIRGVTGFITVSNTNIGNGAAENIGGCIADARTAGSGQATNLSCFYGIWGHVSTGTVVNYYSVRVDSIFANNGTITNTYGVYVGDITIGTQTNTPYSFFASDAGAWNYFAGPTGIGTFTPASLLHAFLTDAATNTVSTVLTISHDTTGTPASSAPNFYGSRALWKLESSTASNQDAAALDVIWTTSTHATRTSAIQWSTVNLGAALAVRMALSGAGGLSVGDGSNTMPVGVINAVTGFRQGGLATSGEVLMGNGTNIVLTPISAATFPHTVLDAAVHTDSVTQTVTRGSLIYGNATPKWDELLIGAANRVLRSDGTDPSWAQVNLTTDVTGTLPVGNGGTGTTTFVGDAIVYTSPAGTALQADADLTFDVTNTQVTLSGGLGAAGSELTGFKLINPTFATAGNQKWTPTIVMSGQGWSTDLGGLTKTVEFMQYVATVQGTAAPTGYWVLERDIDNSGTFVELLRADSTGFFRITKDGLGSIDTTLAQSLFGLQMHNGTAATAGTTTQDAPTVMFKGAAWNSSASSSQDWRWRMIMKGVTVAGTTRSYLRIDSGLNASNFGNPLVISSNGGISVGALIEAAFGVCSVQVGYQIAGAAASGNFLRGNGTNFVSSAILAGDISAAAMAHDMLSATHTDTLAAAVSRGSLIVGNATPKWSELNIGAANRLLRSDGTDASWAQAVLTTDVTGVLPIANGGTGNFSFVDDGIVYLPGGGGSLANSTLFRWFGATQRLRVDGDVYLEGGIRGINLNDVGVVGDANQESLFLTKASIAQIYTRASGTGTLRPLELGTGGGGSPGWPAILVDANNDVLFGTTAAAQAKVTIAKGTTDPLLRLTDDIAVEDTFTQYATTTTDGTTATLATIPISVNRTYLIEARVRARRTGGVSGTADDGATYIRRAMVTTKAGTVTINSVDSPMTQEDQAAWNCTLTVSGANILVRVTGAADNNISWHGTVWLEDIET